VKSHAGLTPPLALVKLTCCCICAVVMPVAEPAADVLWPELVTSQKLLL
jgi:hypothetical protein